MDPPNFCASILEMKGLTQPFCRECLSSASRLHTREVFCLKYRRQVFLYSTCGSFERRIGADPPVVDQTLLLPGDEKG